MNNDVSGDIIEERMVPVVTQSMAGVTSLIPGVTPLIAGVTPSEKRNAESSLDMSAAGRVRTFSESYQH